MWVCVCVCAFVCVCVCEYECVCVCWCGCESERGQHGATKKSIFLPVVRTFQKMSFRVWQQLNLSERFKKVSGRIIFQLSRGWRRDLLSSCNCTTYGKVQLIELVLKSFKFTIQKWTRWPSLPHPNRTLNPPCDQNKKSQQKSDQGFKRDYQMLK